MAAMLGGFGARVGNYSSEFWQLFVKTTMSLSKGPIIAYLQVGAQHCGECPQFHSIDGKRYDSFDDYLEATDGRIPTEFECGPGCHCWLEPAGEE